MKNFYLIFSKLFHDEVMSRASRGQVEGNTCVEHFSHKALMLLTVLVMSMANIGMAWAESQTFAASEIISTDNKDATTTKGNITIKGVACGSKTQDRQMCMTGKTTTNKAAFQLSSAAGNNPTTKYIEISVPSGYKITSVTLEAVNGGSSSAGKISAFMWNGTYALAFDGKTEITIPGYAGTCGVTTSVPGISGNAYRTVRIYKQVKYTGSALVTSGGTSYPSSANTANIHQIIVECEAAATKKIYLKNTMGWVNAYVTRLGTSSYWDDTNGSGSNGRYGTFAMTYDSAKKLFYYDAPADANDTYLCFTADNQQNYANFNGTQAVYVNGGYVYGKVVWVQTDNTFYKNNTKYYGYEDHTGIAHEAYSDDVFLSGTFNAWAKTNDSKFSESAGTFTKTIELAANTAYQFQIVDNAWFGNNGGVVQSQTNWDFYASSGDCHMISGPAGNYTFTYNRTTNKVSISYPDVEHPNAAYVYYDNSKTDWTNCQAHHFTGGSSMVSWNSCPAATAIDICGTEYFYSAFDKDSYSTIIFHDGSGTQTGDWTLSGNGGKKRGKDDADWSAFATYTISFNGNGKTSGTMSSISSITANHSQTITSNTFEKSGYTFAGWKADVAVKINGSTVSAGTVIDDGATLQNICGNIALTAQWTCVNPTITTDLSESQVDKYVGDASPTLTVAATAAGGSVSYQWYSNTAKSTTSPTPTALTTGASYSPSTAAAGTTYYFCKITNSTAGCSNAVYSKIAKIVVSEAIYTVTYNVNGGGTVTPASVTQASSGASVTLATPSWSGYTIEGWYNNKTKLGNAAASYTPTANITAYAHWTDNISGKVFSFIDNNYGDKFKGFDGSTWVSGGGSSKDKTYTNGDGVQFVVDDGGWDNKSNAISSLAKFFNGTTSMSVVIPTGKKATVKILYGAYSKSNKLTVNEDEQTAPSTALTDEMTNAQVFAALKEISLSNQTGTLTLGSSTGNIYIGRVSAVITGYTVSYDKGSADGASGSLASGTKTAGSSFTLSSSSSAFTRSGYTYDGWSVNENGSTKDYELGGSYTTDAPITLYPHWVAESPSGYTVTYEYNGADGGSQPASATGASVTLPNPTKTGCTLQGWYTSSGALAGAATATYNPTSNITLYALWREDCAGSGTKTLVDINFKDASWSGETFSQGNTTDEDCINGVYFWSKDASKQFSLADNTSKGLTFPNNNMSSGNYYFCIPITGINSSDKQITVTLKHGYSSNKASYKYVYVDGRTTFKDADTGGSSGTSVTDAANADTQITFTKSSLSNTSGHLIIGRGGSDFTKIYGVTVTTPSNATCYYVTYNGNGATGGFMVDETAHGSGDNVAILANTYTRTGYTFTGWKTAPSSGTDYAPEGTITGISSNITLYAQWSAGTLYSVTYNGNGATSGSVPVDASSPYASGSNVTVLGNTGSLALANYTFDGWATANDGTGTSYTADGTISGIAADVELFAKWKQTVTLNTGSQGSEEEKTPYIYINGAALNGFSAHSATGYTLNGYYSAASGGTKVLEADGSFAATDVTNYVTGGKWSRTDATTLYAQWRAAGGASCNTIDHISDFPSSGSTGMTVGNLKVTYGGSKTSRVTDRTIYNGQTNRPTLKLGGNGPDNYVQGYLGGNEISSLELGVSESSAYAVAFSASSTFSDATVISWSAVNSQYTPNATSATSDTLKNITVPSGAKYFRIYRKVSFNGTELGAGSSVYVWHIKACTAGASTHTITYANGGGTGTMTSDADIADDGSQPLTNNSFTAPTNFAFAGWVADVNVTIGGSTVTAGTLIANGATITNITKDIALTAKWSQTVTLDDNNENHGATGDGSATAYYNAAALSSITHTTAASGYKLAGYYTAKTDGTKVLNADGTYAGTAVTGWISDSKWTQNATSTPTLYAQYESAGALTWNLGVNTNATSLTTSSKVSSFTQIAVANMTNAVVTGLTYTGNAKSNLTGKISTPASEDAGKYVSVTFQVADGYKFTPNSVKVKVQPISGDQYVKLELTDNAATPNSISYTTESKQSKGSTSTVEMTNGSGTYFTGTVTLKIFCYGKAYDTDGYRLGTPISIDGEVEELCATMPSFTKMNYTTTTFAPNADASGSPITIVGGENIDTYQWKYNKVNDRTSGTNCGTGTSLTPLTNEGAAADVTRYYWCEMTNEACDITIKSPAVAITVAAAKSDATVVWTDPGSTPNYGGGGYTIKATVDQTGWDGNAADLVITAPAGINIYNVTPGTDGSSRKYVEVHFDVQTSFDRSTYASNIPFTVSADATSNYNAISNDHNVSYSACAGAGEGSSYKIRMRKTVTKDGNYYHCANTDGWISPNISSSYSTGKAGTKMATDFDTVASSNTQYVWVRTYHANVNKVRIYADFRANDMTVSNVYKHTAYFSADSKYAVDYTAVYNGDEENENTGTAAQGYVDITLDEVMAANDILLVKFNDNKVRPLGAVITEGSAGSLNTYLQWSGSLADGATVKKSTTDAYFTYSASMITENTNSLGAITYSSSVPSVATVDATGKVAMVAAGTTTIKATLAASGCYKKAEISYTLNVSEPVCSIAAGTLELTSGSESKCSSDYVTLTLTGFESGATLQWKDGDTDINNGGNYTIGTDGTTLTTNQPGTYSVIVTKGCFVRSNRITITNKSTTVHVTRLVKEWYIKNGRLTPDIALWELGDNCSFVGVTASDGWDAGTDLTEAELGEKVFYEKDGIVYMKGTEPKANAGAVQNYTLTLTVNDGCGEQTLGAEGKEITIHHQQNTDKHVLAFVVNGTEKGDWTAGVTADQTTNVGLYNAIAAQFDVQATNIYSTDDEQKLREYYSQYDILCITDYPNTQTKGVNSKSYVDAIGALIDIRPILTMEAFVSKLANWKAKGISGSPKSPTTRQYTMDLQCKDHEIFAGTELTKVGEGDEAMYRVSMVDNTKEDYATLDATYGGGAHAEKEGYQYGKKPALQGFTFTQEMSDNDLLPIGLIGDGAGNPLQVGIERQRNMEARLMVLGINSYAMERLTNDGERVVINALNYLMKKNQEDIADCSTAFVGGAVGHEKDWDNPDNWTGNTVPLPTQKVRILAECEVSSTVYAQSVLIVTDGQYNHGSDNAAGKLTIKENGALIVSGKIQAASAPAYNRPRATTPDKLLIETSDEHQAALIFDNEEGETQATVNLYSLGRKPSSYQYQYFAVPMEVVPVNPTFANETHGGTGIYTYVYNEATSGWTRRGYYTDLLAFEGLGITTKSETAMNYTMTGNLASTATKEITLTKNGRGLNLIGNSWMAPIQIGALAEDNTDANITKTVYIYCAGRDATEGAATSGVTETAGQWLAVPFEAAEFETWKATGKLSVIPAMQAFEIKVSAEATLTLDYDKVVRGSTNDLNAKLRAPGRRMATNEVTMTNIRVADSKTHTDLSLFEGDRFSEAFDNGWEAEYMNGDGRSAKLYAETETGKMAVVAMEDYEGTVVGFAPGKETEYTFSFMGEDNGYYLNDIKLQNSVRISEGETYTFTYEEGDAANRFYISRQPLGGPAITTGVDEVREEAKPRKFIYNDKMYILFNGRVFDATGKAVK